MLEPGKLTRGKANDGRRGGDVGGHGLWDDGPRPVCRRRDGGGISLRAGDAARGGGDPSATPRRRRRRRRKTFGGGPAATTGPERPLPALAPSRFLLPSRQKSRPQRRVASDAGGIVTVSVAHRLGPGRGWELVQNTQEAEVSLGRRQWPLRLSRPTSCFEEERGGSSSWDSLAVVELGFGCVGAGAGIRRGMQRWELLADTEVEFVRGR